MAYSYNTYDPFEKWKETLSESTLARLYEHGPEAAAPILADLEKGIADNSVRNPSGYVTKALVNLSRMNAMKKSHAGAWGAAGKGGGKSADASLTAQLEAWEGTLEPMCCDQLKEAGPLIANALLDELSDKLMSGSVKNPTGWILSSLKNVRDKGPWGHILDVRSCDLLKNYPCQKAPRGSWCV